MCQALHFLINDGGHWPAVIVADSEIALSAMDGMRALFECARETLIQSEVGGVNVVKMVVRRLFQSEQHRRQGGLQGLVSGECPTS